MKILNFLIQEKYIILFCSSESVGLGTTAGDSYETTFDFGGNTITRSIPMGSLYLENHKFEINDKLVADIPGSNTIAVFDPSINSNINFEDNAEFYVKTTTPNTIGLSTTLEGPLLFFDSLGASTEYYVLKNAIYTRKGRY